MFFFFPSGQAGLTLFFYLGGMKSDQNFSSTLSQSWDPTRYRGQPTLAWSGTILCKCALKIHSTLLPWKVPASPLPARSHPQAEAASHSRLCGVMMSVERTGPAALTV